MVQRLPARGEPLLCVRGRLFAASGRNPPARIYAKIHFPSAIRIQVKIMSKTALITGATSGFGVASVRRFATAGWKVIATGRRADRLKKLVDELGAQKIHPAAFDMRDAGAMDAALAAVPGDFQDIDLLVNNAGLALGTAPAQKADLQQWRQMIDTNVTGLVTLTHRLLPKLVERKGAIINISSVAASYPYPGGNAYGGTKAFVVQFSLGLRSDLHGTGVRVTCVEPGMAETEFTLVRTGGNQAASDTLYKGANPMTGDDIAETLFWIANLPPHLNINRLELMPVNQSWGPFQVYRPNQ
jgi:serine 3-dehydrogenase